MRKRLILTLILCFGLAASGSAQKRKKGTARAKQSKPAKVEPLKPAAPTIGAKITILTKNGDKISGDLLDLSTFSVRFKADNLESTLPLESIAAISFASARNDEEKAPPTFEPVGEAFKRESTAVFTAFQAMASETKSGSSYTEYDRQLIQLRRTADRFVQKYSATENSTEARAVSLLAGAILDYNAARTIWTLKIGTNGTLAENDSPVIADSLSLYPELRTATAATEGRFSADKLIGNLWKKATEKVNLVQAMVR